MQDAFTWQLWVAALGTCAASECPGWGTGTGTGIQRWARATSGLEPQHVTAFKLPRPSPAAAHHPPPTPLAPPAVALIVWGIENLYYRYSMEAFARDPLCVPTPLAPPAVALIVWGIDNLYYRYSMEAFARDPLCVPTPAEAADDAKLARDHQFQRYIFEVGGQGSGRRRRWRVCVWRGGKGRGFTFCGLCVWHRGAGDGKRLGRGGRGRCTCGSHSGQCAWVPLPLRCCKSVLPHHAQVISRPMMNRDLTSFTVAGNTIQTAFGLLMLM